MVGTLHGQPELEVDGGGWLGRGTQARLFKDGFLGAAMPGVGHAGATALDLWDSRNISVCATGKCYRKV